MFALDKLCSSLGLNESQAKIVVEHMNTPYGKCINCVYDKLNEERMECPKCGKFNYNLSDPYVHKKLSSHPDWCLTFCSHLEWSLNFIELDNEDVKGYWCDGVEEFETKGILSEGEVTTKAWIGKGGQGIYQMKIIFGRQAITNFENGDSLIDCIPDENANNWISIDPEIKKIIVELK